MPNQRHVVATVAEIPPGGRKIVEVAGRSIGVFNVNGRFYAVRNSCPHQGGPLCLGPTMGLVSADGPGEFRYEREGEILRCPWHGWEFDIRTGQSWFDPARVRVRRYEVAVEPGTAPGDGGATRSGGPEPGPYVAETYATTIDQRYVVVEIPE